MIDLCPALLQPPTELLDVPGAFAWWYFDLVGEGGMAATLIWSFGLPFLPGLLGSARGGQPVPPRARPSIALAVYEGGKERFYLLEEFAPEAVQWDPVAQAWQMGASNFRWVDSVEDSAEHLGPAPGTPGAAAAKVGIGFAQVATGVRRRLEADLVLPLPEGGFLRATLRTEGVLRRGAGTGEVEQTHVWSPLMAACMGSLVLAWSGPAGDGDLVVEGRAYHDRNSGAVPLDRLGIGRWWWGRLAFPGRELIFYRLIPEDPQSPVRGISVELGADGACQLAEEPDMRLLDGPRTLWGLPVPAEIGFCSPRGEAVSVRCASLLEDGPFYQRFLLEARIGDSIAMGMGEQVRPDRVDLAWMRPFVRMRVHKEGGNNSSMLKHFTGDRSRGLAPQLRAWGLP